MRRADVGKERGGKVHSSAALYTYEQSQFKKDKIYKYIYNSIAKFREQNNPNLSHTGPECSPSMHPVSV